MSKDNIIDFKKFTKSAENKVQFIRDFFQEYSKIYNHIERLPFFKKMFCRWFFNKKIEGLYFHAVMHEMETKESLIQKEDELILKLKLFIKIHNQKKMIQWLIYQVIAAFIGIGFLIFYR